MPGQTVFIIAGEASGDLHASLLARKLLTLDPGLTLDRTLELRVWREATTIFMTSGHGGCGPDGLALAAEFVAPRTPVDELEPGAVT